MRHARYTVVAGRQLYRDGEPFVSIGREGATDPSEADRLCHVLASMLNAAPDLPVTPIPRCSSYTGREKCEEYAVGWLVAPDGQPNPGGLVCAQHGGDVCREYAEKLTERWTLAPLNMGTRCPECGNLFTGPEYARACCPPAVRGLRAKGKP